jgi:hypothetical protein
MSAGKLILEKEINWKSLKLLKDWLGLITMNLSSLEAVS